MGTIVEVAQKRRDILTAAAAGFARYGYRGTFLYDVLRAALRPETTS